MNPFTAIISFIAGLSLFPRILVVAYIVGIPVSAARSIVLKDEWYIVVLRALGSWFGVPRYKRSPRDLFMSFFNDMKVTKEQAEVWMKEAFEHAKKTAATATATAPAPEAKAA